MTPEQRAAELAQMESDNVTIEELTSYLTFCRYLLTDGQMATEERSLVEARVEIASAEIARRSNT